METQVLATALNTIKANDLSYFLAWWFAAIAVMAAVVVLLRQRRLARELRKIEIVAENANDGVLLQKIDGTIIWCNEAYCRIVGRSRNFWIGRKPQKYVFPPDICPSDEEIAAFRYDVHDPAFRDFQTLRNMRADGTEFWNQFTLSAVNVGSGEPLVVFSCRDVTEQVRREEALATAKNELEHAVNFDALTGLANRRKLMLFLDECLRTAAANATCVGLMHIDLDKFKEINDAHGHAAGDAILVSAARTLQHALPENALAARIGGDEFIVVMPDLTDVLPLEKQARQILRRVVQPVRWEGIQLSYGASIGLALSGGEEMSGEALIQEADFALYEVKDQGRGTYAIYSAELRKKHSAQKGMSEDLAKVIRDNGLHFHFQPIINLADGRVEGIETLVRWKHARHGVVHPVEFIARAEDIGLLEALDVSAMKAALDAYGKLRDIGREDVYVSFNASLQTLAGDQLVDDLTWAADMANVPHEKIVVEVLENVLMGNKDAESEAAQQIGRLTRAGFITSLDDFGVGYAGLAHLVNLNVRGLKIDNSLIRTIMSDPTSEIIVRAIINLARDLKLNVIAEGVEDGVVAGKLLRAGCRSIQGYAVSRPLPLPRLIEWLHEFDGTRFRDALRAGASADNCAI